LPPARAQHVAIASPKNDYIFIFGGHASPQVRLNDTWLLQVPSYTWKRAEGDLAVQSPKNQEGHSRTSQVLEQTQVPLFSMARSICSVAMVVSTTKESPSTTCLYLILRPKYGQRLSLQITLQRAEEATLCLLLAANSTSMVAGTPSLNSPTPLDSI
jgi:hypothetical protein